MKEKIKNLETCLECIIKKQWKRNASIVKYILQMKTQVSEKLNKID